ncbi:MAG: hypothetical protein ACKO0M_02940, partial [Cyanobium sp.]
MVAGASSEAGAAEREDPSDVAAGSTGAGHDPQGIPVGRGAPGAAHDGEATVSEATVGEGDDDEG